MSVKPPKSDLPFIPNLIEPTTASKNTQKFKQKHFTSSKPKTDKMSLKNVSKAILEVGDKAMNGVKEKGHALGKMFRETINLSGIEKMKNFELREIYAQIDHISRIKGNK
jgi:hypothetical protein